MTESFGKKDKSPNEGKRPAPTIEGTATEVKVESQGDGGAEAAPPDDLDKAETGGGELSSPPPGQANFRGFLSHTLAGILGGVIGVIALALAWSGLDLDGVKSVTPQIETIDGRLAKLEAATQALETKEPGIPSELSTLSERVTQAEATLKTLTDTTQDSSATPDIAAIDKQIAESEQKLSARLDEALAKAEDANNATVQALQDQIAGLRTRLSALAETDSAVDEQLQPEIEALGSRIAKLETAIPGVAEIVSKETAEAKVAAVAIAFANLRSAVSEGSPFVAELDVLKLLSPNTDLGSLASHAKTGIPIVNALAQSFTTAKDVALTETPAASDGSLLGDLRASAQSLVTIRRLGEEATGDEPAAILARAQADLDQGKLAESVKQVETLDGAPRAAFASWLDQAHARLDAENELKQLESRLLVSLSGATREIGRD